VPKDPFIREKFTKEHVAARKLAEGIRQRSKAGAICSRQISSSP
jgi:hypothetical protein